MRSVCKSVFLKGSLRSFSISGLGEGVADAFRLGGQVAVREFLDDLVELSTGVSLAVHSIQATTVIEEYDVEKSCVGMIRQNVFENVDGSSIIFFPVVKSIFAGRPLTGIRSNVPLCSLRSSHL